jgi:hypothetical protein
MARAYSDDLREPVTALEQFSIRLHRINRSIRLFYRDFLTIG